MSRKTLEINQLEFSITPESFQIDFPDALLPELEAFSEDKLLGLYELAWTGKDLDLSFSGAYFLRLATFFHRTIAETADIELLREDVSLELAEETIREWLGETPFLIGFEYLTSDWLRELFADLLPYFQQAITAYEGTVSEYYQDRGLVFQVPDKIFFHMIEVTGEEEPFAFMATYSERVGDKIEHIPLSQSLQTYAKDQERMIGLLSSILKVVKNSYLVRGMLETGNLFHPILFSQVQAYIFLQEVPLYEAAGIKCRLPSWWKRKRQNQVAFRVSDKSFLSGESLLDLVPTISMDGETYTPEEIRSYLELTEGLHFIKNRWVEVNHDNLEKLLSSVEEMDQGDQLSILEALELSAENVVEGNSHFDVSSILEFLKRRLETVNQELSGPVADSFHGELRPYQETGRLWLDGMARMGLGICLADDMGLGKTIQVLAFLANRQDQKVLLVLPASLIANWEEEIKRFCPTLPYAIYHGSNRSMGDCLTLTTYGTVRADQALAKVEWDLIILDEAQAIKNPNSKQTKMVKALRAPQRIALTGTPIENDLADLFSLFDFLNPGLLGSRTGFKQYTKQLQEKEEDYSQLRNIVSPFILRRLKTDRTVIADLPDKIELKSYIDITQKQVSLYQQVMANFERRLNEGGSQVARRGLILKTMNSLKQILNHPSQYAGSEVYRPADSAKFTRLAELCEAIYKQRERVLIFTQYREIIPALAGFLAEVFGQEGLVLHGQTPVKKRQELVRQFNGDRYIPFMILSLKAGGVGLNLTAANHVIHFDRWWNPAVENQATDRAFRIGQKKDVVVHRFICRNTLEMKIDAMIESKSALAKEVISDNATPALTELSNEEIMNFFSLTR